MGGTVIGMLPMLVDMIESVDVTASAILGVLAVLGAIKSAWNGTLRRVYQNITQIEDIHSSVNEMRSQQKDIGEAIAVLSWAQEGEIEGVNPRAIEERVGVERSMADMIDDDSFYRDGAPPGSDPSSNSNADPMTDGKDKPRHREQDD